MLAFSKGHHYKHSFGIVFGIKHFIYLFGFHVSSLYTEVILFPEYSSYYPDN